MNIVFRALLLLTGGYIAICAVVFFRQREMLYLPERLDEARMLSNAYTMGLLRWNNSKGSPIGWMTNNDAPEPPLLIFHGNAGNALHRNFLIQKLRSAGIKSRIYILDYPGYGSRKGVPTQKNLTNAALDALDALPSPAVVLGESLGTGVTCQAAERRLEKIIGLILITPFDSMTSAATHHYPWLPVGLLLCDKYNSIKALEHFKKPVAVIIGEKDEITPPTGGEKLYKSLHGPAKSWRVPNAGHDEAAWELPDSAWQEVWQFVSGSSH